MTLLATIIMFYSKSYHSNTLKISIGLFLSVLIYYINNFLYIMGKQKKLMSFFQFGTNNYTFNI